MKKKKLNEKHAFLASKMTSFNANIVVEVYKKTILIERSFNHYLNEDDRYKIRAYKKFYRPLDYSSKT